MSRSTRYSAIVVVITILAAACGDGVLSTCDPGETQPCSCPGGAEGAQVCDGSGDGWGACDCESDTDADTDSDSSTDSDADADGDGDTDVDSDSDSDSDTDSDSDADTDADADTDVDSDADSDGDTDTGPLGDCETSGGACTSLWTECPADTHEDTGYTGCVVWERCCMPGSGDADTDADSDADTDADADADTDTDSDPVTEWCDGTSGLCWQNPPSAEMIAWSDAIDYCDGLTYAGHSDWRLPTISELRSLINGCDETATGGACGVTDDCLSQTSCWDADCYSVCPGWGGPGDGGCYWDAALTDSCLYYFLSSSTCSSAVSYVWAVVFGSADVFLYDKTDIASVRCVRDDA